MQIFDKEYHDGYETLISTMRQSRWDRICNLHSLVYNIDIEYKVVSIGVTSDQQLLIDSICSPTNISGYLESMFDYLRCEKRVFISQMFN